MHPEKTPPKNLPPIDGRIIEAAANLSTINFLSYQGEPHLDWLTTQGEQMMKNIGITPRPIKYIRDYKQAQVFTYNAYNEKTGEWRDKWNVLRFKALSAADVSLGDHNPDLMWNRVRDLAEESTNHTREHGNMGVNIRFRCGSFLQYFLVEEKLGPENPMQEYVDVYRSGSAILGMYRNELGIYLPSPK